MDNIGYSNKNRVFTDAYHDFSKELLRYAHVKLGEKIPSDDLVQETFLKTWIYLEKKEK